MEVKFNDLKKQFAVIEKPFYKRLKNLTETSQYILGKDVEIFEQHFAEYIGCKYCVGVNSGTDAITLAIRALIKPNTLVITQANTFIATIYAILNAIKDNESYLHVIDCDKYGQIDIEILANVIANNYRYVDEIIIVPVHMYGGCADINKILKLAKLYNCKIIEDCAQAHGTICENGKKTGNIGDFGCFSFYPGKNLGALGDAGAITTNSKSLYNKILKERNIGSLKKYKHSYPAYNSRMDSIQAIVLDEKLKYLDEWNEKRNIIAKKYYETLGCGEYLKPPYCYYNTYHLFPSFNLSEDKLKQNNIQYGKHYPITTYDNTKKDKNINGILDFEYNLPNMKKFSKTISLPMHPFMTEKEIDYVCNSIRNM